MLTNKSSTPSFGKLIYTLLVLSVCFPYLTIIDTGSDVQPYSLLIASAIIPLVLRNKLPKILYYFLFTLISAFIIFISNPNLQSLRSFYGYLSFFIIFTATYLCCTRWNAPSPRLINSIVIIWGVSGLIQLYIDPNIFSSILPRDTSFAKQGGRGVESLAAEPTFYGFILLLFLLLYVGRSVHEKTKIQSLYLLLIIIQVFFVSRSSSAIFTLLSATAFWIALSASLKTKAYTLILTMLATFAFISNLDNLQSIRAVRLFFLIMESPTTFLLQDQSANSRLLHIYYSISAFINNLGIPQGFNSWSSYVFEMTSYNHYATTDGAAGHGRVMSFIGGLLYELGILALPFLYAIFKITYNHFRHTSFLIPAILGLLLLLLQSIPLSLPLLPFILAIFCYWSAEMHKSHRPVNTGS